MFAKNNKSSPGGKCMGFASILLVWLNVNKSLWQLRALMSWWKNFLPSWRRGDVTRFTIHFYRRENQKKVGNGLRDNKKKPKKIIGIFFQFFNVFSGFLVVFFFTTTVRGSWSPFFKIYTNIQKMDVS